MNVLPKVVRDLLSSNKGEELKSALESVRAGSHEVRIPVTSHGLKQEIVIRSHGEAQGNGTR